MLLRVQQSSQTKKLRSLLGFQLRLLAIRPYSYYCSPSIVPLHHLTTTFNTTSTGRQMTMNPPYVYASISLAVSNTAHLTSSVSPFSTPSYAHGKSYVPDGLLFAFSLADPFFTSSKQICHHSVS